MSSANNRIRRWPLAVIVVLAISVMVWIWTSAASQRQTQVFQTVGVLLISFLLIVFWLLFFSRLRWKVRLISFGVMILMLVLSTMLFRVRGFSGDLVPIFEWRWAKKAGGSIITTTEKGDSALSLSPTDYPQFLGPNRNATVSGIQLARDWSNRPPRLVWRQPIGAGWSAFAIVGNSAITKEQRDEWEMVVCYDLKSGKDKWSHRDRARYDQMPAGVGPRATPTIAGSRVYTLGATGLLNCLELETGEVIWSKDIIRDNNAKAAPWGVSGSPLILGDWVVVSAGGSEGKSLVAYHKNTGERIWSGGNARSGYSSPQIVTVAGVRQLLIFNYGNVAAHHPLTGQVLWQQPWPKVECVAQPVPLPGDRVFVSSGYGIGAKLFQIQRDETESLQVSMVWETPRFKAKFTNVVYRDGYIYGLDDGVLACLDVTDGQRKWKRGRYGHGQVILVDDLLLVQAESGDVVLVELNPDEHRELGRFPALEGNTWNSPALAGTYLLVRNDREAACYELPLE